MQHDDEVEGALLTRDESRILSWSADGTIRTWDAKSGEQIGSPMSHDGPVRGVLLAPDETRIISWSDDGTLRIWDLARDLQIGPSMRHEGPVYRALPSHDRTKILSLSKDRTLRLWDANTAQQIGPAMRFVSDGDQSGPERGGALFSEDDKRILSWSPQDGVLQFWDVASGAENGPPMKQRGVKDAVLSRDETRILSWSSDEGPQLWDVATRQRIGPTMNDGGGVNGAILSYNDSRVLSWSIHDGTVRLWDVSWRGRNLLEIACNYSPPDHDTSALSHYGLQQLDRICDEHKMIPAPNWSSIERAPAD